MTETIPSYDTDDSLVKDRHHSAPQFAKDHAEEMGIERDYHVIRVNGRVRYAPGESPRQLRAILNARPQEVIEDIPVLPDSLRNISRAWVIRWAQWVAAGRPDVKPIDERDLTESPRMNDWNPALHPRDPDTGKFVERTFSVPSDSPDFTERSTKQNLQYLQDEGEDINEVLDPNAAVTVDGVPRDATSIDDIPEDEDDAEAQVEKAEQTLEDAADEDEGDSIDVSTDVRRSLAAFAVNGPSFNYAIPKGDAANLNRVRTVLDETDDSVLADGMIQGLLDDPRPTSDSPQSNKLEDVDFQVDMGGGLGPDEVDSSASIIDVRRSFGSVVSNMEDPDEVTRVIDTVADTDGGFQSPNTLIKDAYRYAGSDEIRERIGDEYGDSDVLQNEVGYKLHNPDEFSESWEEMFVSDWTLSKHAYSKLFGQQVANEIQDGEDGYIYTGNLPMGDIATSDTFREKLAELRDESQQQFRQNNGDSRTLYRGLANPITTHAAIESWSTDQIIADSFDGYATIEEEISADDVLVSREKATTLGEHEAEQEVIVLGGDLEVPDEAKANAIIPDSATVVFYEPEDFDKLVGKVDVATPFMFAKEPVRPIDVEPQLQEESPNTDQTENTKSNTLAIPTYDESINSKFVHTAPVEARHHANQLGLDGGYHVATVNGEIRYLPGGDTDKFRGYCNARPRDIIRDIPVLPDSLRRITKAWLNRWGQWVAAGRPDVKPISERDLDSQQSLNDWNPALHPRDPDTGKFVERTFSVPDDSPDFTDRNVKEVLAYLQNEGENIDDVLNPNSAVTIDGVPRDAVTIGDIPDDPEVANPDIGEDGTPTGMDLIQQTDAIFNDSEKDETQSVSEMEQLVGEAADAKTDFSSFDQYQAKTVAEGVGLLQERDEGVPDNVNFIQSSVPDSALGESGNKPVAAFARLSGETGIVFSGNGEFNLNDVGNMQQQNYLTNPKQSGLTAPVVHELGHAVHFKAQDDGVGRGFHEDSDNFESLGTDEIIDNVSKYASVDMAEFIAESYVNYIMDGDIGFDNGTTGARVFKRGIGKEPKR